jgi:thioredoxin 1
MKIKFSQNAAVVLIAVFLSLFGNFSTWAVASVEKEVPVKGMVTLIDLGAHACIPCKMMAPILAKLEKDYQGKAAIVFIDVWRDKSQAERFGISSIPTQIFYDSKGQEVFRHEGFMSEKAIIFQLKKLGVN